MNKKCQLPTIDDLAGYEAVDFMMKECFNS
jgi:hypothetical protein